MTPIEIIVLVAAMIVPIKVIMDLKRHVFWLETVTCRYWGNATVTTIFSLIVVIVALVHPLQALTIVQIWVTVFISLALAPFSNYMLETEQNGFLRRTF